MYLFDTRERLVTLFNKETGLKLQTKDVVFSNASAWLQNGCNAKVTVTAAASSLLITGTTEFFYNRWRLDEFAAGLKLPGKPGDYANTTEVLAKLRSFYQLSVYPEDFFIDNISATATSVTITPRTTALAWQPPYPLVLPFE